jgi:preprotein translocase subunit YajC
MFISPAFAQAGVPTGDTFGFLVPLVLIFVVFYFLLIRPQQKKAKEHREMVAALRRGQRIVTAGGLIGTISREVDDREILVEIAEGVRVRVIRGTVADVLTKPEPAENEGTEAESPKRSGKGRKSRKQRSDD